MNIIKLYDQLKDSYKSYLSSFVTIKDKRIEEYVNESIQSEKLWPKALIAQLPVLSPDEIHNSGYEREIVERVSCLCWFNHDLDGWIEELRSDCPDDYNLPNEPLIWNEKQRAVWLAELDAIFAHLYGLNTDNLRYILEPEDVCGEGCVNETFRVLKDNELRQFGEYRTKRFVLEAWDKFGFNDNE